MKTILNEAVKELVIKNLNALKDLKLNLRTIEHKGAKLNALYETREEVLKTFKRLDILVEHLDINFPEDELEIDVDTHKFVMNLQLEDMLNVINETYIGTIEEELEEC